MAIYLSLTDEGPEDRGPAPGPRQQDIATLFEERDIPLDGQTLRALLRFAGALAVELGFQHFATSPDALQRTAAGRLLHSARWRR